MGWQSWAPEAADASNPWVKVEFGKRQKCRKVVLYRLFDKSGGTVVHGCSVEIDGRIVATATDEGRADTLVLEFPPVETDAVTIKNFKRNPRGVNARWLSEIEIY